MSAERQQPDEERRPADVAEPAEPRGELLPDVVAGVRRAGQLRQLADDDVDRGSGEEAGHDGAGEEPRDPPQPQDREQEEQPAGDERDRRHQLGGLRASHPREEHGSTRDRRQRRARPRRDVPRRAEQRVDDRPGRRRIQPVLHRHARDARVAEVLRDDHRRHRQPGEHVAAQHRPVVARQPAHDRQQAAQAAAPRVDHASILSDGRMVARRSRWRGNDRALTQFAPRVRPSPARNGRAALKGAARGFVPAMEAAGIEPVQGSRQKAAGQSSQIARIAAPVAEEGEYRMHVPVLAGVRGERRGYDAVSRSRQAGVKKAARSLQPCLRVPPPPRRSIGARTVRSTAAPRKSGARPDAPRPPVIRRIVNGAGVMSPLRSKSKPPKTPLVVLRPADLVEDGRLRAVGAGDRVDDDLGGLEGLGQIRARGHRASRPGLPRMPRAGAAPPG